MEEMFNQLRQQMKGLTEQLQQRSFVVIALRQHIVALVDVAHIPGVDALKTAGSVRICLTLSATMK